MSVEDTSDELEKSSGERQPWEPPTEEDADRAVAQTLAAHLGPVEVTEEKESVSEGDAKPEEEEKQEEEKAEGEADPAKSEETKEEGEEVVVPKIPVQETAQKPGRLEKRIAKLYIQNLNLSEQNAPNVEEVLAELTSGKYTHDQKMAMLHLHRKQNKQIRGVDIRVREPDEEEDAAIVKESEKEQIRQEIVQEERQKFAEKDFVAFLGEHPELDEETKDFNPALARAVETLWKGGMPIRDAFETVTSQFEAVKVEHAKAEEKAKQKALSGVMSASTQVKTEKTDGEYTWAEFDQLMREDPSKWQSLVEKGYTPKS